MPKNKHVNKDKKTLTNNKDKEILQCKTMLFFLFKRTTKTVKVKENIRCIFGLHVLFCSWCIFGF